MKKIILIFILIIIYVIVIAERVEPAFVEKIDLNLEPNEMGITFISLEDSKSLLINKDDLQILILLEYFNSKKMKDVLDMFGVDKLDYVLMNSYYKTDLKSDINKNIVNRKLELEQMVFLGSKNIIEVNYLDHNFCVFDKIDPALVNKNCQYIYFMKIDDRVNINDNVNMIFYDEETNPDYLEPVFDKWIDMYMIKKDYYVTLKLDEDTYDTITVPLYD